MKEIFFKKMPYLKEKFLGSALYSKNKAVVFGIIFLFTIAVFSYTKIKIFSQTVKNPYAKNILVSISAPFVDMAKKLPFENFFKTSRKNILVGLKLNKDYHWDNFYYDEKALITEKEKTIYAPEKKPPVKNETTKNNENTSNKILKLESEKKDEGLVVVNYDYTSKHPLRVLFAGDSQMQSLIEGFKRNIGNKSAFSITELAVISSGFIRTDYYNWPAKFKSLFVEAEKADNSYDAVVLLLGMNDNQNFFDGNGNLFIKGSKEWTEAYAYKIKDVMDILQAHVKKIYWLGLPIVKSPGLNAEIKKIEAAQIQALDHLDTTKIQRISLREIAPGKNAAYTDFVKNSDGHLIKFMKSDGTHYTLTGGSLVMSEVEKYFYSDFNIEPRF